MLLRCLANYVIIWRKMEKLIKIFKALSDSNRLRVVATLLQYDELCACQIVELMKVTGSIKDAIGNPEATATLKDFIEKGCRNTSFFSFIKNKI